MQGITVIDSNQRPQQAAIGTYQDGYRVSEEFYYINQGTTEITLQYREGAIENGEFDICVAVSGGIQGCGKGYDGPEKKPEYVRVNVHSDFVPVVEEEQNNGNSQSQSQSSNNENNNENNNALSQSQETKIYICNEGGCKIQ